MELSYLNTVNDEKGFPLHSLQLRPAANLPYVCRQYNKCKQVVNFLPYGCRCLLEPIIVLGKKSPLCMDKSKSTDGCIL